MKQRPFAYGFRYRLLVLGGKPVEDVFAWASRETAEDWRRRLLRNPEEYQVLTPVVALFMGTAEDVTRNP